MKYVIGRDPNTGFILPAVFDESLTHIKLWEGMKRSNRNLELLSAGFCYKGEDGWYADQNQKSESLKIGPMTTDGAILALFLDEGTSGVDLHNRLQYALITLRKTVGKLDDAIKLRKKVKEP